MWLSEKSKIKKNINYHFFKIGGLNDVIEGFFSKTEEKMSLKVAQMNLMSV